MTPICSLFIKHLKAEKIIKNEGLSYGSYDDLQKLNYAGYAHYYTKQKWNDSLLQNEAKLDVYKYLFEIDCRLGTKSELQLWWCCAFAVNINIIMVINIV